MTKQTVKPGQIFAPKDKRRDNRRIRVVYTVGAFLNGKMIRKARVESRLVGQRKWSPAPAIRLDRLTSRAYRLVSK